KCCVHATAVQRRAADVPQQIEVRRERREDGRSTEAQHVVEVHFGLGAGIEGAVFDEAAELIEMQFVVAAVREVGGDHADELGISGGGAVGGVQLKERKISMGAESHGIHFQRESRFGIRGKVQEEAVGFVHRHVQ